MPEIIELYQYSPNNNTTSWVSEDINVSSANNITFTVFCDQDCDISIEWSITSDFGDIVDTDTATLTGGNSESLQFLIKARYARFKVENIAATPNILVTQGFFWS
jgi:hypothetical protein